jgi:hypothetical protein
MFLDVLGPPCPLPPQIAEQFENAKMIGELLLPSTAVTHIGLSLLTAAPLSSFAPTSRNLNPDKE